MKRIKQIEKELKNDTRWQMIPPYIQGWLLSFYRKKIKKYALGLVGEDEKISKDEKTSSDFKTFTEMDEKMEIRNQLREEIREKIK